MGLVAPVYGGGILVILVLWVPPRPTNEKKPSKRHSSIEIAFLPFSLFCFSYVYGRLDLKGPLALPAGCSACIFE